MTVVWNWWTDKDGGIKQRSELLQNHNNGSYNEYEFHLQILQGFSDSGSIWAMCSATINYLDLCDRFLKNTTLRSGVKEGKETLLMMQLINATRNTMGKVDRVNNGKSLKLRLQHRSPQSRRPSQIKGKTRKKRQDLRHILAKIFEHVEEQI